MNSLTDGLKCDGQTPCRRCAKHGLQCRYEADAVSRARKRQFDEMSERNSEYQELLDHLRGQSDEEALSVVRNIRANLPLEAILRSIRTGQRGTSRELQQSQGLQYRVLAMLTQSTNSLRQLLELVGKVPPSDSLSTQSWQGAINMLQGQIEISSAFLGTVLQTSSSPGLLMSADPGAHARSKGPYKGPTFWVPAQPWLPVHQGDDASVSHLVTIFLNYSNTWYRFVEEDLFVSGMRSRDPQSPYCSAFLVNAALACASVCIPGPRFTRDKVSDSSSPRSHIAVHGHSSSVFNT